MTHEEAIQIIRETYHTDEEMKALESLIPELRESEDERVAKAIDEIMKLSRTWGIAARCGFTAGDIRRWVKKQKEQKPAEWSEEDEKKIHFLSRLIEFQVKDGEYCFGEGACAISKQEAIEMLQSLRPHPKQEWSEEDDATIKSAVHWLEKYLSTIRAKDVSSATQDGILTVKTTITNLKSLPSSWKPSEEQMEELWNVISYIEKPSSNFLGVPALLESLYEQLKKL